MDVALLSQFVGGQQVYRRWNGDVESFGCAPGDGTPLPQTYCQAMVLDQIPNAISDTKDHPVLRALPATDTATIGAYVGVPIRLTDGTLCTTPATPVENSFPRERQTPTRPVDESQRGNA